MPDAPAPPSSSEPAGPEIFTRVRRGVAWVGASQVGGQILRVAVAVTIARLLSPGEYGRAALALVFASLVLVFSDLALGAALVQRKILTDRDRATAFWVTVGSGVAFTLIGVALAGPIASLYGQPDVKPLLMALSASFILTAIGATQQSLLLREMDFRRVEVLNLIGALAGGVVAVGLAIAGTGAWAIIGQQLATAGVTSALLWIACDWRPQRTFSRASFRDLGSFSGPLVGHRLLFYLHQNADRFLIGRALGASALGVYAVAYNLMLVPASRLGAPVQRIVGPAFSRMQDDPERMAAAWARVTRMVGTLAIPGLVGLVLVAPDFIPVVLGQKWAAAIPVVQILAWVGILQALQAANIDILMARDRTSTILRYSLAFCTIHVLAFVIGLHWGVLGVATAYAISSTLIEPVLTVLTARVLGVSVWVMPRSVLGIVQATAGMAVVIVAARLGLKELGTPMALRLVVTIALGGAAYAALCAWRVPELVRDVRSLLRRSAPAAAAPGPALVPAGAQT
jgi:O-antigen/teichoic acid export membrane protein